MGIETMPNIGPVSEKMESKERVDLAISAINDAMKRFEDDQESGN